MESVSDTRPIPLSVPNLAGNEWKYVKECLDTGWISSAGAFVDQFEAAIKSFAGVKHAIAAVNGTAALHIALQLAGVKNHDYVIVPNLTFVASANAVSYIGADPLLVDVNAATWQIDLELLAEYLDENCFVESNSTFLKSDRRRIAAIMPVHILGNMCDMARLKELATRFRLPIVEDSTEALGSTFEGNHAGSLGLLGTYSFNGNKIISTGGGGMIVTNNDALGRRAKHLTTQAKTRSDEYIHDEVGYNYRLVNILAAIGLAQVEQLPRFLERKREVMRLYQEGLSHLPNIEFPAIVRQVKPNNWLQTVRVPNADALIAVLRAQGIDCRRFWVPMNQLPMYKNNRLVSTNDVAGDLFRNCVSIPSSTSITDGELDRVIGAICRFYRAPFPAQKHRIGRPRISASGSIPR